ncbi:MAG: hypothetical protein IKC31_03270 [Clostridia bacterium]|nr:hypothetical protein [Clostridia bacterium]
MEQTNYVKEIRLSDVWAVLKKCWILCLVVLIVASAALYLFLSARHIDTYQSTAQVYLISDSAEMMENDNNMAFYMLQVADQLIEDFQELSKLEDPVMAPTLNELKSHNTVGASVTPERLASMISVEQRGESRVLHVTVTTTNPQASAEICNTYAKNACAYFNSLYTNGEWQIVRVADSAKPATAPSNPLSKVTVLAMGMAVALLVYGIYFVRYLLDDKINQPEDVEKYLGVSVLGVIPNSEDSKRRYTKYGTYYAKSVTTAEEKGGDEQ